MNKDTLLQELKFKAVRSGGAGGQHVNKVSTKMELLFHVSNSDGLTAGEKELVHRNLINRINKESVLVLQCDDTRSQSRNKELVIRRFFELMEQALKTQKKEKKNFAFQGLNRKKARP